MRQAIESLLHSVGLQVELFSSVKEFVSSGGASVPAA